MNDEILIDVQTLTKVYGRGRSEVVALREISFALAAGEVVAVMGPSGCGKSTLLKLLGLLSRPTTGSIRYAGEESSERERWRARMRNEFIGYVHQDHAAIPYETALANVRIPLEYRRERPTRRRQVSAAMTALERVGLEGLAKRKASELSGGERQRVGIARAMINQPRLLLADEPTAALDSDNARQIVDLIRSETSSGSASLIATHDPRVSERCDRVIRLEDGRLHDSTSPDDRDPPAAPAPR